MQKNKNQLHIDEIELFFEPRKYILPKLPIIEKEPEMTEFETAFLCGLLKKYKPNKIVEVGVAGGATTAIILQCMQMIGQDKFEMHSVDYAEKFYRDNKYTTGFMGEYAKEIIPGQYKHYFHLGDIAYSFLHDMQDIDFLIIDTMHILPGEILDFLTLLNGLKNGAVVVLHDTVYNYVSSYQNGYATGVLFSHVVAEKYINHDYSRICGYPNIAAFTITEETRAYIENVFMSLLITWGYMPDTNQISKYRTAIQKLYPKEMVNIFDIAINLNLSIKRMRESVPTKEYIFNTKNIEPSSNIVLYGAGKVGREYYKQVKQSNYCNIVKWVDRNYKKINNADMRICAVEDILITKYDKIVLAIERADLAKEMKELLLNIGVEEEKIVWNPPAVKKW